MAKLPLQVCVLIERRLLTFMVYNARSEAFTMISSVRDILGRDTVQ